MEVASQLAAVAPTALRMTKYVMNHWLRQNQADLRPVAGLRDGQLLRRRGPGGDGGHGRPRRGRSVRRRGASSERMTGRRLRPRDPARRLPRRARPRGRRASGVHRFVDGAAVATRRCGRRPPGSAGWRSRSPEAHGGWGWAWPRPRWLFEEVGRALAPLPYAAILLAARAIALGGIRGAAGGVAAADRGGRHAAA